MGIEQSNEPLPAHYSYLYRVFSMMIRQLQKRLASSRPTSTVVRSVDYEGHTPIAPLFALYRLKVTHVSTSWMCSFTLKDELVVVKVLYHARFRKWAGFAHERNAVRPPAAIDRWLMGGLSGTHKSWSRYTFVRTLPSLC